MGRRRRGGGGRDVDGAVSGIFSTIRKDHRARTCGIISDKKKHFMTIFPPFFFFFYEFPSLNSLNATSSGNLKLAQNILFLGATSRTSCTYTSSISGVISYSICLLISSQIPLISATLSSLFVEKQWTWIMGSFCSVWGASFFLISAAGRPGMLA